MEELNRRGKNSSDSTHTVTAGGAAQLQVTTLILEVPVPSPKPSQIPIWEQHQGAIAGQALLFPITHHHSIQAPSLGAFV